MTKDWSINQVFHGKCYVWAAVLNDIRWLRAVSESKTVQILDRASLGLLTLAAGQCAQKLQSGIVCRLCCLALGSAITARAPATWAHAHATSKGGESLDLHVPDPTP